MSSWEITNSQIREIKANCLEGLQEYPEEYIAKSYLDWVKTREYALLERKSDGQLYPALQSKRGNRMYAKIHQRKLQNILSRFYDFTNTTEFSFTDPDDQDRGGSCVLFFTLNFNPHELSKSEAWQRIRSEVDNDTGKVKACSSMHIFVANLHKLFKGYWKRMGAVKEFCCASNIVTQCTIEAHESGYPHIHMTLILDRSLEVFRKESRSSPGKFFWRLKDWDLVRDIKKIWSRCARGRYGSGDMESFCDIQAAVGDCILDHEGNYCSALAYCLKYQTKTANLKDMKDILTHANLKFWGARSIIGKKYLQRIGAYYRKGDTRHDELINDLQLRVKELRDLNAALDQLTRELGDFFSYHDDLEIEKLRWEYVKLRLSVSYLIRELEEFRDWRYLGTISFAPETDLTGFWNDIKAINSVNARQMV